MRSSATSARPAWRAATAFAICVLLLAPGAQAQPRHLHLDNGIEAVVHSPEDVLRDRTVQRGGRLWMVVGSSLCYELVTDVADPAISNRGDGRFHPMSVQAVQEALAAVRLSDADLALEVFVLPFPRREILDSSARDGMIFLSPGMLPVGNDAVHFTVAHEVGHVYQYRWMPDRDAGAWQSYRTLRGIQDARLYSAGGAHANRPHEIFAEDFRFLLGGEHANYSGSIENAALDLPDEIRGLEGFVRGLCAAGRLAAAPPRLATAPNPFNPSTEVRVQFAADTAPARASVCVLDAQGRQVRQLFDGVPGATLLRLPWDGREEGGARVASGVYFARLDYRGQAFSTKLLLVK